jgi:tetratricopeptide (TPR) repeat protein
VTSNRFIAAGLLLVLRTLVGCTLTGPEAEPASLSIQREDRRAGVAEARSLLGTPLVRPAFDDETRARLQSDLDAAWNAWHAAPTEEMSFVWLGRRLAYLGRYNDAIAVFTAGLETHPGSYRLRRHRGHRHITTRRFDLAIADLREAERIAIEGGIPDQTEPDGAPNELNIPLTTTHSNISYHLALAHYLSGDFEEALAVHRRNERFGGGNDDQRVSRAYWVYRALRELGRDTEARAVLEDALATDPTVIENYAYLAALRAYEAGGPYAADDPDGIPGATLAFGLAAELRADGRHAEARAMMQRIVDAGQPWAAFGFIAAEATLAAWDD